MEAKPPATILWLWVKTRQNPSKFSPKQLGILGMFIQPNHHIIDGYIYIYNYIIYVYTIIPVYRYVLYSIIPPFLAKSSSNPCLGLCKALGFLLPLHLRPYPRSLLVERWFSDMATLTHGTSSIVNLPG